MHLTHRPFQILIAQPSTLTQVRLARAEVGTVGRVRSEAAQWERSAAAAAQVRRCDEQD